MNDAFSVRTVIITLAIIVLVCIFRMEVTKLDNLASMALGALSSMLASTRGNHSDKSVPNDPRIVDIDETKAVKAEGE